MMTDLAELLRPYVRRGKFTLSSGQESEVYVDVKAALVDSDVCDEIWDRATHLSYVLPIGTVVGEGYGGYGIGLTLPFTRSLYITRPEDSPIGVCPAAGTEVVLADDVYTSGATMRRLERLAQGNQWDVIARMVVVDRSRGRLPADVVALCTLEEILGEEAK